jgi:hypothetical protein
MARWTSFDPTRIDLTNVDLRAAADLAAPAVERAVSLAKDATYVTVGLGLLSVQRVQVRRRAFERAVRGPRA